MVRYHVTLFGINGCRSVAFVSTKHIFLSFRLFYFGSIFHLFHLPLLRQNESMAYTNSGAGSVYKLEISSSANDDVTSVEATP